MQIKVKSDREVMAKHLVDTEMALQYLELASEATDPRELVLSVQDVMQHNPEAFAEWLRAMQDARKRLDAIRATIANEAPQPRQKKAPIRMKVLNGSRPAAAERVKSVRAKRTLAHV
ncbi:MAG: hypothetical protein ACHQNE_02230 [Candidatus Kapaibacterium sp.]